ncbi:hypothetical protein ACGFZP_12875 [Kitasatospora sp. NPDC048239]|uniref:hypothetical protein n=1 Tax=Kitasatospora sp. NPDC048239 TaxID=3364046 RepID=UPI0037103A95
MTQPQPAAETVIRDDITAARAALYRPGAGPDQIAAFDEAYDRLRDFHRNRRTPTATEETSR